VVVIVVIVIVVVVVVVVVLLPIARIDSMAAANLLSIAWTLLATAVLLSTACILCVGSSSPVVNDTDVCLLLQYY